MTTYSTPADFGIIGHQTGWSDIVSMVNRIREDKINPLPEAEIKFLFPSFPPRSLFDIEVGSTYSDMKVHGKYFETFMSPDALTGTKENLEKIIHAAQAAIRQRIPITTLGGFTSIVLEGNLSLLPKDPQSRFTTGNTLTAAFIARGITDAAKLLGLDLGECNLMIVGATGDIGSACTHYFKDRVKRLLLIARNIKKLSQLQKKLDLSSSEISTCEEEFTSRANIIICVTSSTNITLSNLAPNTLVVDAGYPKNLKSGSLPAGVHLFHGGMGFVTGGYSFQPDYNHTMYSFPRPQIAHGCILEAIVLAFEKRYESYSANRGEIIPQKMEELLRLSEKHGINRAPFYDDQGLWPIQTELTHTK